MSAFIDEIVLCTIGHSDRDVGDFVSLLEENKIMTLVDIRSQPGSRKFPQYNEQALREFLASKNIVYHWAGRQLGGLRKLENNSNNTHQSLADDQLRAFAEYMETEAFKKGAAQIINMARKSPLVMMCAERLPEHCHRSLIADYLLLEGVNVKHIIEKDIIRDHQLNPLARRESAALIYDRKIS
ncbi:MAG: DUF488 family protein [Acidiferrobacterales bacterium]